jgi:hypothetical protein
VTAPSRPRISSGCVFHRKITPSFWASSYSWHRVFTAPVDQIDGFGAEPPCCSDNVDGGVARADHRHAQADVNLREGLALGPLDELKGAVNAVQVLARQLQVPGLAQSHANEDGIESALELGERNS